MALQPLCVCPLAAGAGEGRHWNAATHPGRSLASANSRERIPGQVLQSFLNCAPGGAQRGPPKILKGRPAGGAEETRKKKRERKSATREVYPMLNNIIYKRWDRGPRGTAPHALTKDPRPPRDVTALAAHRRSEVPLLSRRIRDKGGTDPILFPEETISEFLRGAISQTSLACSHDGSGTEVGEVPFCSRTRQPY